MATAINTLNSKQQAFLGNFLKSKPIQTFLGQKAQHEIAHSINYLKLVKAEIFADAKSEIQTYLWGGLSNGESSSFVEAAITTAIENLPIPIRLDQATTVEKESIQELSTQVYFHKYLPIALENKVQSLLDHQDHIKSSVKAIGESFVIENEWTSKLHLETPTPYSSKTDFLNIKKLAQILAKNKTDSESIIYYFYQALIEAKTTQLVRHAAQKTTKETLALPKDWFHAPWYYLYVQYFGTQGQEAGTFEGLIKMLDYLEAIGIRNIYMLPHYESPEGDGGYDVSNYTPAEALGGMRGFGQFMEEATKRGFRVATDLVFNHTSVEHHWFGAALSGSSKYFNYFLKCPPEWNDLDLLDILSEENGDFYLYLPEINEKGKSVVSKRILIFPDVDKTVWLEKKVDGLADPILFYREFYPFQVDLDLQNPNVIYELFQFLGSELNLGILGKRTDAIAHWIKKPGTTAKDLPETFALQGLIKQFIKHFNTNAIVLPEVVTHAKKLLEYAGPTLTINGHQTTLGGDGLLDFHLQGMLREMIYSRKTAPLWTQIYDRGAYGMNTAIPLVPLEHHDETYMGFIQDQEEMRTYIESVYHYLDNNQKPSSARRGIIYKNGMSAGARYIDCLDRNANRMAMAYFCLYLMPATPVIYYGSEIGVTNNWPQMQCRQEKQFQTFKQLLGNKLVGPGKSITYAKCEDPRELQRGPIDKKAFYQALQEEYPVLKTLQRLNQIRDRYPALRSLKFSHIDTYHESIFGIVRYPDGDLQENTPIVALANLTEKKITAQVPLIQLQEKVTADPFEWKVILDSHSNNNHESSIETKIESGFLKIELDGFDYVLLEPNK